MRLIYTLNDQKRSLQLSAFLTSENIQNQLEITPNTDWGSPNYGDVTCKLWIYDEDQVEQADDWIKKFEANPDDPIFQKKIAQATPFIIPEIIDGNGNQRSKTQTPPPFSPKIARYTASKMSTTFYLIMICCVLFVIDMLTEPQVKSVATNLPILPQMASPLKKATLYDYPAAYQLVDKLANLYPADQLQNPKELPEAGKIILNEFYKTPYWKGAYNLFINRYSHPDSNAIQSSPPLFEKIRQGEFWRLITPSFMHNDILHILFNMLWLVVLGQQIEQRLGPRRYVLLALLIGVFSNTCQYLMSGPEFLGFSGIICGMLTFIWVRQKVAPWEGYPLQKSTINFMLVFIFAMLAIQVVSVYTEVYHQLSISRIANTAHLTGAAFGALLGCLPFFSWKT